eukprot:SAG11_NODE_19868_length_457_cov_1.005587_2_plen_60_part_01
MVQPKTETEPPAVAQSFYAQFYYYIHHYHVDPKEDSAVTGALETTRISASSPGGFLKLSF